MSTQKEIESQTITVSINGQTRDVPSNRSVAELLGWLGVDAGRVAVELNKLIVRKRDWQTAQVPSGAQLEIVEFVGGG